MSKPGRHNISMSGVYAVSGFLVGSVVKPRLPMQEAQVQSWNLGKYLEERPTKSSSILARASWTEEWPVGYSHEVSEELGTT